MENKTTCQKYWPGRSNDKR